MPLSLREAQIAGLLEMAPLIDRTEASLIAFSIGEISQPTRVLQEGSYFAPMPADSKDAVGVRIVGFYPGNADLGFHTHNVMILLFKPDTGEPLAIMEGAGITEKRTAAVSGTATQPVNGSVRDPRDLRAGARACRGDALHSRLRRTPRLGLHARKGGGLSRAAWLRCNISRGCSARRRCGRHRDQTAGAGPER